MSFVKLHLAFGILLSFISFHYSNLLHIKDGGSGYGSLSIMFALFAGLFLVDRGFARLLYMRKTTAILFVFLVYVLLNYIINGADISDIRSVTIGTTGGILFGLATAVMVALSLDNVYRIANQDRSLFKLSFLYTFVLLIIVSTLLLDIFNSYIVNVRTDLFLLDEDIDYQRPATFLLIQYITTLTLVALIFASCKVHSYVIKFVCLMMLLLIAILMMMISQLIGSNVGMVAVLIMFISFLLCMYISRGRERIQCKPISSIAIKTFNFMIGLGVLVLSSTYILFKFRIVDFEVLNKLRIFGFDYGHLSSVDSRIKLIQENFIEQFMYSPILGNPFVDSLTTGEGTYAHSLMMSLMSHQGVIGTTLFIILLLFVHKDLTKSSNYSEPRNMYQGKGMAIWRLIALGSIFMIATAHAFYTWMPFWFAFGLLGFEFWNKNYKLSLSDKCAKHCNE